MNYIIRIMKSIFKWAPVSATVTVADYMYGAIMPAMVTVISAGLFDSAANVLSGQPAHNSLYIYAGLYLGIYLVNDVSTYLRSIALNAGVYEKGTAYFRIELFEKLSKLPLIAFEDAEVQNKKERAEKAVNDETLSAIFNHSFRFIRSGISVVGVSAVLFQYSAWLLPLSLLSIIPYPVARLIRGKEFFYVKSHQAKKTRLLTYLWSIFTTRQSAREMRVMGFDGYITEKWRQTRDDVNEELWTLQKKDAFSLFFCDGFRIAGYGASVAVVLALAIRGDVSIGVFGAAVAAFLSLQNGMQNFLEALGRFPEQLAFASDYYTFFDMPEEEGGSVEYSGLLEEIKLEDVSFRYPNSEKYALKSVGLTVFKGEKIAVVGENGSGKTTLSKVLLGLYPVEAGCVLYDGVDVRELDRDGFYSGVSAIAQDFISYNLSVRENVALSDISRLDDSAAVRSALEDAGIEGLEVDDILGREFGGRELSGGQWQKLAIARGLYKDSEIIVLDEPTSALDPLIETEILSGFLAAADGKTAVIISHRVGLCRMVDRIVVMKDGEIVQNGSHAELLEFGGEYGRLYNEQAKWYKP